MSACEGKSELSETRFCILLPVSTKTICLWRSIEQQIAAGPDVLDSRRNHTTMRILSDKDGATPIAPHLIMSLSTLATNNPYHGVYPSEHGSMLHVSLSMSINGDINDFEAPKLTKRVSLPPEEFPVICEEPMPSSRTLSPDGSVQIDIGDGYYGDDFTPVMGPFGAPPCRCTTAVLSLTSMMIGVILLAAGSSITFFYYTQETLVVAPGLTIAVIGLILSVLGCVSWTSKFMCNDCISRIYSHMKKAPVKEAQRRRAKILSRMSGVDSRLNSRVSGQLNSRCSSKTTVLTDVKY